MEANRLPPVESLATGPWGRLALAYAALIVYGSLYPFSDWTMPANAWFDFMLPRLSLRASRSDLVTNVLAYVPFGLLFARWWHHRGRPPAPIVAATLAGALLSLSVESLQQLLPSRIASLVDLLTNTGGTAVGALLAAHVRPGARVRVLVLDWRERWLVPGRLANLGLTAIALWALSQLTPLVPSLDLGNLRHGLSPLWQTLRHPTQFNPDQWAVYELAIGGLALLALTLGRSERPIARMFFVGVAGVLLLKIVIVTRQLSLEAVTGALAAAALTLPLRALSARWLAGVAIVFILTGFTIGQITSNANGVTHPFNWIPFRGQLENTLVGFASILENLWPPAALAYLTRFAWTAKAATIDARARAGRGKRSGTRRRSWHVASLGGVVLGMFVFGLEWYQQYLPGRYGDFTNVILSAGVWWLFWAIAPTSRAHPPGRAKGAPGRPPKPLQVWRIAGALAVVAVSALAATLAVQQPMETRGETTRLRQVPAPDSLPAVSLAGFRRAHPRLPHPSADDQSSLAASSPRFLQQVRTRANRGKGDIEAAVLQAALDPGSVDLEALHRRLMELRFSGRGHEQGKPLALAYDWLYLQWTAAQRAQLLGKLTDSCNFLIGRIRAERLSPYNVFLYNAPLQALMACSIAIHGDSPQGDPVMNFTFDLWKRRVLPVWRQIMGQQGGWHEGGEYVGIGIGQAMYQLPNMWRSATGEDLFATEAGIRGFPAFLAHRTRPDGTQFRWGDGARFDRGVPDAIPLAVELDPAAGRVASSPIGELVPSAWPWGPLTDSARRDPPVPADLSLSRYFDGIGMLMARSDWGPDATYVTFKAGDNFWSHSHLDQGAFTIYKGGELAIDSGFYGPAYGADHHMNYSYQTIAHNTITVTDPADTIPAPGRERPRNIANDGGQRRIGSGWGVDPGPIDREEWETRRETYHTGTMQQVLEADGLSVGVADLTAAYTNANSGSGTFADRTRRVEKFWRVFGYDRVDDVIVVFDQVSATDASFRKRWLLHTIDEPRVVKGGFSVQMPTQNRVGHAGGRLEALVLLPPQPDILALGGPGFEFFVDDRNYDENRTLQDKIARIDPGGGEPGAWRIEVSPPVAAADDLFLVVMLPTLGTARPVHQVRLLESGGRRGCEIVGPLRTTRWWFEPGRNKVEVEVTAEGRVQRFEVAGAAPPPSRPQQWLDRLRRWFGAIENPGS